MSSQDAALRYIREQLESLCERPEMWGPNLCVELQYLMLLEFWFVTTRPHQDREQPRLVLDEYQRFLRRSGHDGRRPLAETAAPEEFKQMLRTFRDELLGRMAPASPFEDYDLTVAYNLKAGQPLSESVVSHGLTNVRRVFRAAVRPQESRSAGGRPRKEIEALTDFEIVDVDVRPRNGVGARIVIPMRQQQQVQLDWTARNELRDAVGAVVEMAEWASEGGNAPAPVSEPRQRDWIAWQTIRLLPTSDVETMELGGKLIARRNPVTISAAMRPRLMQVLEGSVAHQSFRAVGSIRSLNRDNAVLRFRDNQGGPAIECWLQSSDDLKKAERNLCSQVELQGRMLIGVVRKPVVLVDEISIVTSGDDVDESDLD